MTRSVHVVPAHGLPQADDLVGGRNSPAIRRHNRRLVLHILRSGPLSRRRIAEATGLQPATVTNIVGELIEVGIVHEIGSHRSGSSGGGRPEVLVDFRATDLYVGGVYVGIRGVYTSIGDVRGSMIGTDVRPRSHSPASVATDTAASLRRICAKARFSIDRLVAIGVAFVDDVGASESEQQEQHAAVASALGSQLGRPVEIESAAIALLIAEGLFGVVRDERTILVHVGTRVIAGVQWGHRLLGRFGYWDAPIGHTLVDPAGDVCRCGARGCLDTVASQAGMARHVALELASGSSSVLASMPSESLDSDAIAGAAAAGDPLATRLITDAGNALAIATANALQILNGELAIISGPIVSAGDVLMAPIREGIAARMRSATLPRVVSGTFGLDERHVAGLALALDRYVFSGASEYVAARSRVARA